VNVLLINTLKNVPLPTLQKWLGHEDLNTTAIYAQAVGDEERQLASRLW
jgi:integrase